MVREMKEDNEFQPLLSDWRNSVKGSVTWMWQPRERCDKSIDWIRESTSKGD